MGLFLVILENNCRHWTECESPWDKLFCRVSARGGVGETSIQGEDAENQELMPALSKTWNSTGCEK